MALTPQQQARQDQLVMLTSLRIEEYLESEAESKDADLPFGDIVYELEQSCKYVLRLVERPLTFSSAKEASGLTPVEFSGKGCVVIPLPEDYLRFTRLKINGWDRAVNSYMSDQSRAYKQQVYSQRRGVAAKPVVFLVPYFGPGSTSSQQALEAYPAGDDSIEELIYIPFLKPYELPVELEDAVIWKTVSALLTIMRETDLAKNAMAQMLTNLNALNMGMLGEEDTRGSHGD